MDIEVIETPVPFGIGGLQPGTVFRTELAYYIRTDEDSAVRVDDGTLLGADCFWDQAVEVINSAKMVIER